ncbi:AMP-binding protein [Fulvivirga sedimenti]|uniref:AMP-binding protein n=1 Tax=Fulvivirga sedimenti TaxID=2879465 RepID=A0A9X1HJN9_9BACT|nr:AMP-binding protein [Fulvivirga sedimenti]MCA6073305.1 AMP-binding protein [Fulvivirga sedimenti]
MSQGITINDRFIPWTAIPTSAGKTIQEQEAISFISRWLTGTSEFELKTSGSTGTPGTIIVSREQMELSALRTLDHFGLGPDDHALVAMNTKFIAGKMMLLRALLGEMHVTVQEPSRLPNLEHSAFTFLAITPLQLQEILDKMNWRLLTSYKCILVGGAPVSAFLRKELSKLPLNIFETYGMTETVSHIAVRRLGGPSAETLFTCIHDLELKTDTLDRLQIKGAITSHQWLQTNDRVLLHGKLQFEWLGRSDWVINSGGIKIQPEKLEEILEGIFSEQGWKNSFYIHGWPHHAYGEVAILIIEGNLPAPEIEIKEILLRVIDRYEIPKKIVSLPSFIRTETGKIQRIRTAELLSPLTF